VSSRWFSSPTGHSCLFRVVQKNPQGSITSPKNDQHRIAPRANTTPVPEHIPCDGYVATPQCMHPRPRQHTASRSKRNSTKENQRCSYQHLKSTSTSISDTVTRSVHSEPTNIWPHNIENPMYLCFSHGKQMVADAIAQQTVSL
jgi:hypothetical protein